MGDARGGRAFLTDRYTPSPAQVKEELALAFDLAEQLTAIVGAVETLTPRRVLGPTLERRLRTSIETILKCAEWNLRCQRALEEAWLESDDRLNA